MLLVFERELFAKLDEVSSGNRNLIGCLGRFSIAAFKWRNEVFLVGKGWIAADSVEVLNATLGR